MVFSAPAFLFLFLPISLVLTTISPRPARNIVLLLLSMAFYVWGAGGQIAVIGSVALASWVGALVVGRETLSARTRKIAFLLTLAVVLLPLLTFKYWPITSEFLSSAGVPLRPVDPLNILLPLGISFFTFHAISYLVDVRRGDIPPETGVIRYALYLFLYPHQIAGPIVRYAEIRDEIQNPRHPTSEMALFGMSRFAWGLFKKAFVADSCASVADSVYALDPARLNGPTAWLGALAYALQIYFDFSGYSDMAIGLAAMLGFHFPENFKGPYRSVSVTEFWRRWHVTLSRWFRDYVYIPFGGNRHGTAREYTGLILTFGLTALWHGAAWTFLAWGALHSAALLFERITGLRKVQGWVAARRIGMVVFILMSWVPFRSTTMGQATDIWSAMIRGGWGPVRPEVLVTLSPWVLAALLLGCSTFLLPKVGTGYERVVGSVTAVRPVVALAITVTALPLAILAVVWIDFSPFLYFRF